MAGRYSARGVDKDAGWIERRFREAFQQIAELRVGKISAVPGSTLTITQLMTDPAGLLGFINTDTATATADDIAVVVPLTKVPRPGSLHVRKNGLDLRESEWVLVDQRVTVAPAADVIIRTDDVFDAAYAYDPAATVAEAIVPTWRDTAPQNLNAFLIPDDALVGDLLVFVAMMPDTESVTALNGCTLVGVSDYVTHTAVGGVGGGTRTYRLEVYTRINDGSSKPTVSNVAAEDVVCASSAFADGQAAAGTFDTLDDGTSASAPALINAALRVWGTIGDTITITPSRGTVVLSTNYVEIDIAMTVDPDPSAAPATASGTAGWCLASLSVTA